MTVNVALFLSSDGIALAHRQAAGHWAMIGETRLDVDDLGSALATLRDQAVDREGADFETLLVLPDDQILYTSLTAPTQDPELTAFRIEEGLDGLTPYSVTELEYDWRATEEDRVKIAVVARETLDEARAFAGQYGFVGAGFAAMPPMERFPGVPLFDLSDAARDMDFSADGIAFGPDTHGMPEPEPEPAPEPEPDPTPDPVPPVTAEPEVEVTGLDAPAAEPDAPTAPIPPAAEEAMPATPIADATPPPQPAEPTAPADPVDVAPPSDPADTPTADDNPALAEALAISAQPDDELPSIEDPGLAGPIAPLTDDALEDPETGEDPLPPAPSPASREARQRARALREERGTPEAPAPAGDSDVPQFSARRGRVPAPEGRGAATSPVGERTARIGLGAATGDAPGTSAKAAEAAGMPKLAEQLKRVRAASKSRPKSAGTVTPPAARPRVEIPPRAPDADAPAPRPNPFDAPTDAEAPTKRRKAGGLLGGAKRDAPADGASGRGRLFRRGSGSGTAAAAVAAPEVDADGGDAVAAEDAAFSSGLLARKPAAQTGGSFRTGLILTVILLVLLVLVAVWSALFLPNSPVARLFGTGSDDSVAAAAPPATPQAPDVAAEAPVIGASPEPSLADEAAADGLTLEDAPDEGTAEDPVIEVAAVVDPEDPDALLPDIDADLDLPPLPEIDPGQNPSLEEAEALYAEDQIWARSPDRPDLRPFDLLDRIYTASIDPAVPSLDAVALPDPGVNPGELLRRFPPPPPFGAEFELTENGLVAATPGGVLTPEGAFVRTGAPPIAARQRPREIVSEAPATDIDEAVLNTFRPTQRPEDLAERRERQLLGGLTNDELGERRPPARPQSPQEAAARASLFPGDGDADGGPDGEAAAASTGTDLAVARSLFPQTRPANIAQIVASAERRPVEEPTAVAAAAVAPGPDIPSNADVSRAATERNAIRLRNVNLIGVTGTPSDRRALVRLSSGRFIRVGVGDRLDGGRVAAIGETTLQYVRNGRTVTLEIPG